MKFSNLARTLVVCALAGQATSVLAGPTADPFTPQIISIDKVTQGAVVVPPSAPVYEYKIIYSCKTPKPNSAPYPAPELTGRATNETEARALVRGAPCPPDPKK